MEKRPLGAGEATSLAYRDDADETQIRGPQAIPTPRASSWCHFAVAVESPSPVRVDTDRVSKLTV